MCTTIHPSTKSFTLFHTYIHQNSVTHIPKGKKRKRFSLFERNFLFLFKKSLRPINEAHTKNLHVQVPKI